MIFQRKGSGVSWLLVGLGNPGSKYESTRHNMGFLAVDGLARRKGFRFNKLRFRAWTAEWMVNGEKGAGDEAPDLYEPLRRIRRRGGPVL